MPTRLAVVVSQGQSQNPARRTLEEDIVAALIMEPGVDVTVVPHLYDLHPSGTGMLALEGIKGNLVVLSWLYERAARWVLDRNGIRGQEGTTLIKMDDDDEDEDEQDEDAKAANDEKERVIDHLAIPARRIYCLDLRVHNQAQPYVEEIQRIAREGRQQLVQLGGWVQGQAKPEQMQRFLHPTNNTALGPAVPTHAGNGSGNGSGSGNGNGQQSESHPALAVPAATENDGGDEPERAESNRIVRIEEEPSRRWYPVIDFSRCTNCMECIDFCLFGVYGVDAAETILVEQPDNCRKGCPACSRVCPENAIIFPQHKTPAIAGAAAAIGGLKIDLSRLFGAPDSGKSAVEIAAIERDEQLVMAGRDAVGIDDNLRRRAATRSAGPKDELDSLVDELDDLDL